MENKIGLCCAALNFKELTKSSIDALKRASLANTKETVDRLKSRMSFPTEQIAVIKKCNAVILLVVHSGNTSQDTLHDGVLSAWDGASSGGITELLKMIKLYDDEDAVRFMGECAVGLHSVVIGDSQVYSQVYDGIKTAASFQSSSPVLDTLAMWLQSVHLQIMQETGINNGNLSLERLACDRVADSVGKDKKVAVIGLGESGKLVTKILAREKNLGVVVTDRTETKSNEIAAEYKTERAPFGDYAFLENVQAGVMALETNPSTAEYTANMLRELKKKGTDMALFVDLSTPPLLEKSAMDSIGVKLIDITDLSQNKSESLAQRQHDANRARELIAKRTPSAFEDINNMCSKALLLQQRQKGLSRLSREKLELLKARDIAFTAVRKTLHNAEFAEVQTPYIVGLTTDPPKVDRGKAFAVSWPGGGALLRQSPQLYKQIVVISGQDKLFEIGPFWRMEETSTIRHLDETTGLDIEMRNVKSLNELYDIAYDIIINTWTALKSQSFADDSLRIPLRNDLPILQYKEAVELLNQKGYKIPYGEDLGLLGEAHLGNIIKKERNSDIVIIEHYPTSIKKFYTYERDDGLTETFDMIFAGWELISGAIRETRIDNMKRRMRLSNIDPAQYSFYLEMIAEAPPHGGFGMGLDRLIAKMLGIEDIRNAVLFPRTLEKLIP